MQDYHAVLDLPPTATAEQIDARYRQFVRMFDPALYDEPLERAYVEKKLKAVDEAYRVLCRQQTTANSRSFFAAATSTPTHRRPTLTSDRPVRWLHRFGLSMLTIIVATLVGSAALDQGLGVLAYVTHLQQGKTATVAQIEPHLLQPRREGTSTSHTNDWTPFYSADKKHVAFVINLAGKKQLVLGDPRAGQTRQLTHATTLLSLPLWSPQADRLAFLEEGADGPVLQIFVLTANRFYSLSSPNTLGQIGRFGWTPDGNALLFEIREQNSSRNIKLWRVDSSGQQLERYAESDVPALVWSTPLQ